MDSKLADCTGILGEQTLWSWALVKVAVVFVAVVVVAMGALGFATAGDVTSCVGEHTEPLAAATADCAVLVVLGVRTAAEPAWVGVGP